MSEKRHSVGGVVLSLLMLAFATACAAGCAPSARLTFPRAPVRQEGAYAWYDVAGRGDGRGNFALVGGAGGRVEALAYDDDGDGRPDRVYRLADYAAERVPHLIVLLDSLPFGLVADRYAGGDFRWFDPPQKVIAPFPSLTEVCYTELLHAPPLPGMIDIFYDPRTKQQHHGLWERVTGYEEPWERRLAYHATFAEQGLIYLRPRPWHAAEVERVRRALDASPDRVTLVYVTSASGMMYKYGRAGAEQILDDVRQLCLQLLYERQGAIKISLMADHGHNLMASKNLHVADVLRAAGFNPTGAINDDRDAVVEINGLVSYCGVHTRQPGRVADALLARDEVELAAYVEGDGVRVRSARGAAVIEASGAGRLRYRPVEGDVLGYKAAVDAMRGAGQLDAEGFASDEDWFAATKDLEWPDAPRRLWDAFHGEVASPPTVMLSLRDGWCAGLPSFEHLIKVESSHGGLNQVNSATFVMTMAAGRLTRTMRTRDVMQALEPGFSIPLRH